MLLVRNVMGIVLMCVGEDSVPQLMLMCPPSLHPMAPRRKEGHSLQEGTLQRAGTLHSGEEHVGHRLLEEDSEPASCSGVPWLYVGKNRRLLVGYHLLCADDYTTLNIKDIVRKFEKLNE